MRTREALTAYLNAMGKWKDADLDRPLLWLNSRGDRLTFGDMCQGVLALGETGSGKSSALRTITAALLKRRIGITFFTAKADDADDALKWCNAAGKYARGQTKPDGTIVSAEEAMVHVIGPGPNEDTINILDAEMNPGFFLNNAGGVDKTQTEVERIENVVMSISAVTQMLQRESGTGAGDDTWMRAANQLLRSLLTVIWAAEGTFEIETIYRAMTALPNDPSVFQHGNPKGTPEEQTQAARFQDFLANNYMMALINKAGACSQGTSAFANVNASARYLTEEFPFLAPQTSSSVTFTLSSVLDLLQRDPLRRLLCSQTTVLPEEIRAGKCFIINMPVKRWNEIGQIAQVLIKRLLQRVIERTLLGCFVALMADEFQFLADPKGDVLFASTARGSRCMTVNLTQNIPLLTRALGGHESGKNTVAGLSGNFTTKILFLQSDSETKQWAADLIDKNYRTIKQKGSSTSYGGGLNIGTSINENRVNEHILMPVAFSQLKSGGTKNDYTVTAVIYKTGVTWSNGKPFLLVSFDQKRQGIMSPIERKVRVALGGTDFVRPA